MLSTPHRFPSMPIVTGARSAGVGSLSPPRSPRPSSRPRSPQRSRPISPPRQVPTSLDPLAQEFVQSGNLLPYREELPYSSPHPSDNALFTWPTQNQASLQPYGIPRIGYRQFTGHRNPQPMYFQSSPVYPYTPHSHPPLPAAVLSSHVGTLADPSGYDQGARSGFDDASISHPMQRANHQDIRGHPSLLQSATGYSSYPTPSPRSLRLHTPLHDRPAGLLDQESAVRANEGQSVPSLGNEQLRSSLPSPPMDQHAQPMQRLQEQFELTYEIHNDGLEQQPATSSTDRDRHPDRHPDRIPSSHNTSARRTYESYLGGLSQSITSSDVEEAAARSPPSNRVRWDPTDHRARFQRYRLDPNHVSRRQITEFMASQLKWCLSELPQDTSSTCDICAKDYSATHVQPTEDDEVAIQLSCGHTFGEWCLGQWLNTCKLHKNKMACPMCRKVVIEPLPQCRFFHMYARHPRSFTELLAHELPRAQYELPHAYALA